FKTAEFDILYGEGISKTGEIVDIGAELGILEKSGAWYSYEGTRIGQGRDKAREALFNDPALEAELEAKIKEKGQAPDMERDGLELDDDEIEGLEESDTVELDIRLLDIDEDEE
ncbi:MAG: recombinase RecA, partial [Clostridia bacterium]|nr:recombinase RecA [Clostridia bacterium]